jgi:hypothetical protein
VGDFYTNSSGLSSAEPASGHTCGEIRHNHVMPTSRRSLAALLLVACVAVGAGTRVRGSQGPTGAQAGAESPVLVRLERLVDRVWVVESSSTLPPGGMYVFLSDNVLVTSSTGKPAAVGTWAEDVTGLVITERGTTSKVDVLELTPERLRLRVKGKTSVDITFAPAIRPPAPAPPVTTSNAGADSSPTAAAAKPAAPVVPIGTPYRCGGDAFRLAFEGDNAYVTWPDGTSVVLREVKTAEPAASRKTYSDGQIRVVEDTSEAYTRVLFARPGFRPRPCSPAR